MDGLVLQLTDVIRHEVSTFEALLDALSAQQEALVTHDLTAIEASVSRQREAAERAGQLEAVRTALVKKISRAMAEDPASLTLRRLIARLEGPEADRLREMRESLVGLHEKIQRANRHNALLIRQSMRYVDRSLEALTGSGPSTGVYGKSGTVGARNAGVKAVLNKVV